MLPYSCPRTLIMPPSNSFVDSDGEQEHLAKAEALEKALNNLREEAEAKKREKLAKMKRTCEETLEHEKQEAERLALNETKGKQ